MVKVFIISFLSFLSSNITVVMFINQFMKKDNESTRLVALLFNPVSAKVCTVKPTAVYHNITAFL